MLSVKPERAVDGKKSKAIATKYDAADIAEMIFSFARTVKEQKPT